MRFKLIIFALVLMHIPTSLAFSQRWDQAKGFGLNSSLIKFIGDQKDRAALGMWNGLKLKFGASPYVMIDMNLAYGSFKPSEPGSQFKPDPDSPYRTFLFPFSSTIKMTPVKHLNNFRHFYSTNYEQ